jgi:crotonobetainyl-CoA:carnitine CoA-transferase CaiB-like acyl-CoA transferase
MGPLDGVRVLDLTHVLNGPFCTMLLGFMGADVIKVENRLGDRYRHAWMPVDATRDGYGFLSVNSNKRSITLDLKSKRGRELLESLILESDVLVENFSPGVMERLGFDEDTLFEMNPRLIYARSSGYGHTGPYRDARANASTNNAITGWQHAAEAMAGTTGVKVLGIGDQASGVSMALGICAALFERAHSGRGQTVDVSMQEALLGFMTEVFHTHFESQRVAQPPKQCADGYYAFHLPDISDELWGQLCTAMGEPDLADSAHFNTAAVRRSNYEALEETVARWVRSRTRSELWNILMPLGLSSAPVLTFAEAIEDPHLESRGAFIKVDHPQVGSVRLLAPWIRFSRTPAAIERPAPLVGQHNREVFEALVGLADAEVSRLEDEGVI